MQLNQSRVVFDQAAHKYWLDGVELRGITGVLSRQLFPNKYTDIPDSILKNAAEKGSFIHEQCELADSLGIIPTLVEAKNYLLLKQEHGLTTLENEYLVSDNEFYASSIDVVFDDLSLADIKTTSTFDNESVSWQLSCYAYLFELQNPELKAGKLYGIWLRGAKKELIEVKRIDRDIIRNLLHCDVNGERFENPFLPHKSEATVPTSVLDVEQFIVDIETQIKELQAKREALITGIEKEMLKADVLKWQTDSLRIIRKLPTVRESVDSKKLKEKYPDIYNDCLKSSKVKGTIQITLL